jgi:hypothetical protein
MTSKAVASTWSDATPEQLLSELLDPLVRILIRNGIEPAEISRAFTQAMASNSDASDSQVNVRLGGMQRDCMEVMCRWRRDSRFLDDQGLPVSLPQNGNGSQFSDLCKAAGVKSEVAAVLCTLAEFGAVEIQEDGLVTPLTPTFIMGRGVSGVAVDGLLKQISGFLRVVDHNTKSDSNALPRFERMCTVVIADELLPVFERTLRERGQEFIDGLDEWLERHRSVKSAKGSYSEVGAGAYFVDLGKVEKED